jgi:(p)ppGpp synthase/HD superfamily hydrolase
LCRDEVYLLSLFVSLQIQRKIGIGDKIMNPKTATIEDAIAVAAQVHKGQTDKSGAPYILHPLRLMMQMETETEMIVAVLHDVVEDSRDKGEIQWTFGRLREYGFSEEVLTALDCVTNRAGESYDEFVKRASKNPIARRVKVADLEDNMNIKRIGELKLNDLERLKKYHRSWSYLNKTE